MANRYNLREHVGAIPGEWWIAGEETDRPLPGALQRDEVRGGWRLDIYGALTDPEALQVHTDPSHTLHGFTSDGAATASGAILEGWQDASPRSGETGSRHTVSQTWRIHELVVGGHFYPDQLWRCVRFTLPRFSEFFPGEQFPDAGDISSTESSPATIEGATIVAWRSSVSSMSRGSDETKWEAGYQISSPVGFTLETVDRWIRALQNLHDVLFGGHGSPPGYELQPIGGFDESFSAWRTVRPFAENKTADSHFPFFDLEDIDFEHFIPAWIYLHTSAPHWPTFGPVPGSTGYLENRFLEAANRVEATSRALFESDDSIPEDEQEILNKIQQSSLNSQQRRRVRHGLKVTRQSLSKSLELAAEYSNEILPSPAVVNVPQWSKAVADARNTLTHGLTPANRESVDPYLLIALEISLRVVQKLAMLRAAGYTRTPLDDTRKVSPMGFDPVSIRQRNSDLGTAIHDSRSLSFRWTN